MPNWFVGVPVPAAGWLEGYAADAPAGVRVFHPDDLHMTVAFLGSCGEERAALSWDEIGRYTGGPFEVALAGLEPLGNPRRPSALSLVVTRGRSEAIALLVALRDALTIAAEAEPDDRPPLPHITIARINRRASPRERKAALEWARAKPPVGVAAVLERIVLYTWTEDRRERQFQVVQERALSSLTGPS